MSTLFYAGKITGHITLVYGGEDPFQPGRAWAPAPNPQPQMISDALERYRNHDPRKTDA